MPRRDQVETFETLEFAIRDVEAQIKALATPDDSRVDEVLDEIASVKDSVLELETFLDNMNSRFDDLHNFVKKRTRRIK